MLNAIYEAAKADKENDENCNCQKIVIFRFLYFSHLDQDLSSISQFYDTTQIKKHALSRVREQAKTDTTLNQNEYILRDEDRRKIVAKTLKEAKLKKL